MLYTIVSALRPHNWFMNRLVDKRKILSRYVVDANSIKSFEWRLEIYGRRGSYIQSYHGCVGCLVSCSLLIFFCILVYTFIHFIYGHETPTIVDIFVGNVLFVLLMFNCDKP